jgi:AMP-activated protein kinase-like protein
MVRRTRLFGGSARVTFRLDGGRPDGTVSVVGDFNGWRPGAHELVARRDGSRSVSVTLVPGEYHFRYLATGGVWFDDEAADALDGDGGLLRV